MPASVVKTAEQERLWNKAKKLAEKQGHAKDYAYIMGIFKQMGAMNKAGMPGIAKPGQGALWETAKRRARAVGRDRDYDYVLGLYQQMTGWKSMDSTDLEKSYLVPSQMFNYARVPGQIPSTENIEAMRLVKEKPKPFSVARLMAHDEPRPTASSVVRDLGLDIGQQRDWIKFLESAVGNAINEVTLRQDIMSKCLNERLDSGLRKAILQRSLVFWRGYRKSMVQVMKPDELRKADTTGGKYYRRVPRDKGGYTYYYDEEKYRNSKRAHTSGKENTHTYISGQIEKAIGDAGKGGCGVDAFKGLVKKFGAKAVAGVLMKNTGGKYQFQKKKFTLKEAKAELPEKSTEKQTAKSERFFIPENLGELSKAGPHKYTSRKKVKGKWVYEYPEDKKKTVIKAILDFLTTDMKIGKKTVSTSSKRSLTEAQVARSFRIDKGTAGQILRELEKRGKVQKTDKGYQGVSKVEKPKPEKSKLPTPEPKPPTPKVETLGEESTQGTKAKEPKLVIPKEPPKEQLSLFGDTVNEGAKEAEHVEDPEPVSDSTVALAVSLASEFKDELDPSEAAKVIPIWMATYDPENSATSIDKFNQALRSAKVYGKGKPFYDEIITAMWGHLRDEHVADEPKLEPDPVVEPTETTYGKVDPELYDMQSKFGSAGGPRRLELTQKGRMQAAKVATGLPEPAINTLMLMSGMGGANKLIPYEVKRGHIVKLNAFGEEHIGTDKLGKLSYEGLIVQEYPDTGRGYRITEKGKQAIEAIHEERKRLLDRVKKEQSPEEPKPEPTPTPDDIFEGVEGRLADARPKVDEQEYKERVGKLIDSMPSDIYHIKPVKSDRTPMFEAFQVRKDESGWSVSYDGGDVKMPLTVSSGTNLRDLVGQVRRDIAIVNEQSTDKEVFGPISFHGEAAKHFGLEDGVPKEETKPEKPTRPKPPGPGADYRIVGSDPTSKTRYIEFEGNVFIMHQSGKFSYEGNLEEFKEKVRTRKYAHRVEFTDEIYGDDKPAKTPDELPDTIFHVKPDPGSTRPSFVSEINIIKDRYGWTAHFGNLSVPLDVGSKDTIEAVAREVQAKVKEQNDANGADLSGPIIFRGAAAKHFGVEEGVVPEPEEQPDYTTPVDPDPKWSDPEFLEYEYERVHEAMADVTDPDEMKQLQERFGKVKEALEALKKPTSDPETGSVIHSLGTFQDGEVKASVGETDTHWGVRVADIDSDETIYNVRLPKDTYPDLDSVRAYVQEKVEPSKTKEPTFPGKDPRVDGWAYSALEVQMGNAPYEMGDVLSADHDSMETAYVIDDYPYGRQRTQMRVWIETNKNGQRVMRQTQNPRSGRWNKPKASTYSSAMALYMDDNGHVQTESLGYSGNAQRFRDFTEKYPDTVAKLPKEQRISIESGIMYGELVASGMTHAEALDEVNRQHLETLKEEGVLDEMKVEREAKKKARKEKTKAEPTGPAPLVTPALKDNGLLSVNDVLELGNPKAIKEHLREHGLTGYFKEQDVANVYKQLAKKAKELNHHALATQYNHIAKIMNNLGGAINPGDRAAKALEHLKKHVKKHGTVEGTEKSLSDEQFVIYV